jgi:hypothetical protein
MKPLDVLASLLVSFTVLACVAQGPADEEPARGPLVATSCPCPQPTYLRLSSSATLAGTEDYVELDTDAGLPLALTLPASPTHLYRLEVWLGNQPGLPGGVATVDPNGQAVTFAPGSADLVLDVADEGLLLLFVKPTPAGGGYWRASSL